MDMQRTEIIGHISQGSKIDLMPSGQPVAEFSIACNNRFKAQDGSMKDDVLFMDCKVYGKRAEKLAKYLIKGKKVRVEGRLKLNRWEKDGVKHSKIDLLVNNVLFLSAKEVEGADVPEAEMANQ